MDLIDKVKADVQRYAWLVPDQPRTCITYDNTVSRDGKEIVRWKDNEIIRRLQLERSRHADTTMA